MLPSSWQTARLHMADATPADLDAAMACLAASHATAALDPAFGLVPADEVLGHIKRSTAQAGQATRDFQMQMLRLAATAEVVGYWHFMRVPVQPQVVGVSILLLHPRVHRQGLGQELVGTALPRFAADLHTLWARVYLANVRALAFWAGCGLDRLVRFKGDWVATPQDRPNIILSRPLPGAARAALAPAQD